MTKRKDGPASMNGKQRKYLRGLAHSLRPAVQIGTRGLTESVFRQVDQALRDHELIKIKVSGDSPIDHEAAASELHDRLGCEIAGSVGHVVILYRPDAERPRIQLPAEKSPPAERTPHGEK